MTPTSLQNHSNPSIKRIGLGLVASILTLSIIPAILILTGCESNNQSTNNALGSPSTANVANGNANNGQQTSNNATSTQPQVRSRIRFPVNIKELPILLHPITPMLDAKTEEGILSSLKSKGKDNYQPVFSQSGKLEYQTRVSNIGFEALPVTATHTLFPHNNFLIYHLFIPHTTSYKTATDAAVAEVLATDIDNVNINQIETVTSYDSTNSTKEYEPQIVETTAQGKLQIKLKAKQQVTHLLGHMLFKVHETPYQKEVENQNLHKQHALYMSDIHGKHVKKLHPDNEYLHTVQWYPALKRYYFETQTDSDNNGLINNKDDYHNYVIDFKSKSPVAKAYSF